MNWRSGDCTCVHAARAVARGTNPVDLELITLGHHMQFGLYRNMHAHAC